MHNMLRLKTHCGFTMFMFDVYSEIKLFRIKEKMEMSQSDSQKLLLILRDD